MKNIIFIFITCLLTSPPVFSNQITLPPGILSVPSIPAPVIRLNDIDGRPYNLNDDHGSIIFVHFWASWCVPCRKEMPAIQRMWNKMKGQGLKMVLVNTSEDEDTVFSFLATYAPDIRPLLDSNGQATEKWKPRGLPATFLVDKKGNIVYQVLGGRPWDEQPYLSFLKRLINQRN